MLHNNFSDKKWIDLVFENRNQSYGAYQLRLQSGEIMMRSLAIGVLIVSFFISIPVLNNYFNKSNPISENPNPRKPFDFGEKVIPVNWEKEKPKPTVDEPEAQPKKVDQSAENIIKHTAPNITENDATAVEIPTEDDLRDAISGSEYVTGNPNGVIGSENPGNANIDGSPDGVENGTGTSTGNEVFEIYKLDSKAEFPGGLENFTKLIKRNFNAPEIEKGPVTVQVSFIVEKDGSITDIKILRDPGYGLGQEAIRTLSKIKTKWTPGMYKGKPVRTLYYLPIKIDVQ